MMISTAWSQRPPDAGSLLRQQEQNQGQLPLQIPGIEPPEVERPALHPGDGLQVTVQSIRFSGALDLVPESALQALLADSLDQSLDFAGLQGLAVRVTEYLRAEGWLLARAYLPNQDVTEGVIEIAILKGRLDGSAGKGGGWQVSLNKDARMSAGRLEAMAERAAPSGGSVRREALERALLLMNDLPGISARSRLQPGTASGTTRIRVEASEAPLLTGNTWANNYGNHSTGSEQLNAGLILTNPGGFGDQANLDLTLSQGIRLARLGYSLPLGYHGLRLFGSYTAMRYEVVEGSGEDAGFEGDSRTVRLGLTYPFIRTRHFNLNSSFDLQHKALEDDYDAGTLRDKRINVVDLGLFGDSLDTWQGGGLNNFGIHLGGGDLDLSRVPADEQADAESLKTQGNYWKLGFQLSRLQRLPGQFTLLGKFSGQLSRDNLDSSEQFILGGPSGVRAYPVGEAQGDEGCLFNLDLRYQLPWKTAWGAIQLNAFYDTGYIRLHNTAGAMVIATETGKNSYRLSGFGLGLALTRAGSHSIRLVWAHSLGDNDGRTVNGDNADGDQAHHRLWLQAMLTF